MAWMADTYAEATALLGRIRSELPEKHSVVETLQRALDRCAPSRDWRKFAAVDWSDHDMVRRARLLLDRMDVRASLAEAINRAQYVRGECRAAMPDNVVSSLRSALRLLDGGGYTLDSVPPRDRSAVSLWRRFGSAEPWEVWKDGLVVSRHKGYYEARAALKALGGPRTWYTVSTYYSETDDCWMVTHPTVDKWGIETVKLGAFPTLSTATEKVEELSKKLGVQPSIDDGSVRAYSLWA